MGLFDFLKSVDNTELDSRIMQKLAMQQAYAKAAEEYATIQARSQATAPYMTALGGDLNRSLAHLGLASPSLAPAFVEAIGRPGKTDEAIWVQETKNTGDLRVKEREGQNQLDLEAYKTKYPDAKETFIEFKGVKYPYLYNPKTMEFVGADPSSGMPAVLIKQLHDYTRAEEAGKRETEIAKKQFDIAHPENVVTRTDNGVMVTPKYGGPTGPIFEGLVPGDVEAQKIRMIDAEESAKAKYGKDIKIERQKLAGGVEVLHVFKNGQLVDTVDPEALPPEITAQVAKSRSKKAAAEFDYRSSEQSEEMAQASMDQIKYLFGGKDPHPTEPTTGLVDKGSGNFANWWSADLIPVTTSAGILKKRLDAIAGQIALGRIQKLREQGAALGMQGAGFKIDTDRDIEMLKASLGSVDLKDPDALKETLTRAYKFFENTRNYEREVRRRALGAGELDRFRREN